MQLQSTVQNFHASPPIKLTIQPQILLLASVLAVASASPTADPNTPNPHPNPYYPFTKETARIRTWTKDENCPRAKTTKEWHDSPTLTVPQNKCIDLPHEFLSYKIWQPLRTTPLAVCTFSVYPEPGCSGEAVAPVNAPATQREAVCASGVTSRGSVTGGSRSVNFGCECLGSLCEAYLKSGGV